MEESAPKYGFSQPPNFRFSAKKGRSGYEPSDTETEWQEIPQHERERKTFTLAPEGTKSLALTNKSPTALHRRHPSRFENETSSPAAGSGPSQSRRNHHSKSPYKPQGLAARRNINPLPKSDLGRNASPYKPEREKHNRVMDGTVSVNRKHEQRTSPRENRLGGSGLLEVDRVSEKPNYRGAVTAPRSRGREKDQQSSYGQALQNGGKTPSPLSKGMNHLRAPLVGEINEIFAQAKLSNNPTSNHTLIEGTNSIQPGDTFFSRECNALQVQKTALAKSVERCGYLAQGPRSRAIPRGAHLPDSKTEEMVT